MVDITLAESIKNLRARYRNQLDTLETEALAFEQEIENITASLKELEARRVIASQKKYQAQFLLQGMAESGNDEILDLIVSRFEKCQRDLKDALGANLDNRLELEERIKALLSSQPDLEPALRDYKRFNTQIETILASTPEYFRNRILLAHQKLKEKLSGILELQEQLENSALVGNIDLPILQTINETHSQVFWILPATVIEGSDLFALRMNALENAFMRSLSMLAAEVETILPYFNQCEWAGYRGVTTLSDEADNQTLSRTVQAHLEHYLMDLWPFPDRTIQVQVIPIDFTMWVSGQEKLSKSNIAEAKVTLEEAVQPIEFAFPIFNEKDITSWDRPLRIGLDSHWNIPARRLRTLFVRMISQGRIGQAGIPEIAFLAGLPLSHREAFENIIPILLERNILITEPYNTELFCINPAYLGDIQDLINRDITTLWAPVIAIP